MSQRYRSSPHHRVDVPSSSYNQPSSEPIAPPSLPFSTPPTGLGLSFYSTSMAMPQMQSPRPIHRLSYLQRPIWDPASTLLPEAHPDHMDVDRAKSWEDAYDPFAQFHLPGPPANDAFLLLTPVSQSGSFQRLSEPPNPLPSQSLPSSHAESYSSASYPPSETFHLERSASIFSQPGVKMDDSLEWTGNLPSDFRGARTSVDPEIFAMPGAVYDAHRFVQSPTPAETRASSHSAPSLGKQPRRDSVAKQTSPRLSPERPKLVPVKRRRTPRENANWICEICDMPFERSYNLKSHMDTHDPDRPKPFKCEHEGCQREFVRKTDLTRHVQSVHVKAKDWVCTLCEQAFARKDTLRRHEEDGCPKRFDLKTRDTRQKSASRSSAHSSPRYQAQSPTAGAAMQISQLAVPRTAVRSPRRGKRH